MFKVGDKVRVISNTEDCRLRYNYHEGDVCKITGIETFNSFPGKTFYRCKIINEERCFYETQYMLANWIELYDNSDRYFFIEYGVGDNNVQSG